MRENNHYPTNINLRKMEATQTHCTALQDARKQQLFSNSWNPRE